ncbi:MAG: hypothetical protein OXH00_21395 [Candidatus Poribacteria bacterium]|nr:hypothetical protein [Candidatus Poribacteria bacterium]
MTDEAINKYSETELKPIWEFPHWDVVKNALELKGKIHDMEVELAQIRKIYLRLIR